MADFPARDSKVAACAAGIGGAFTDIASVKEIGDWTINNETVDRSTKDTGRSKKFGAGRVGMSFSMSGEYDEADAGQTILVTAAKAGTSIGFRFRPATGGGKYQFIALGIITNFKVGAPADGQCPFSCDVQVTGDLTHTAQ